jgi:hypothetical protein
LNNSIPMQPDLILKKALLSALRGLMRI